MVYEEAIGVVHDHEIGGGKLAKSGLPQKTRLGEPVAADFDTKIVRQVASILLASFGRRRVAIDDAQFEAVMGERCVETQIERKPVAFNLRFNDEDAFHGVVASWRCESCSRRSAQSARTSVKTSFRGQTYEIFIPYDSSRARASLVLCVPMLERRW